MKHIFLNHQIKLIPLITKLMWKRFWILRKSFDTTHTHMEIVRFYNYSLQKNQLYILDDYHNVLITYFKTRLCVTENHHEML